VNTPPDPPPEGVLIESCRHDAGLSVREAARRAVISEGWWRQVVKGYQSLSGGSYGLVRDVPARTIARMAKAVQVPPERLAAEGGRPDAAQALARLADHEPGPRDLAGELEAEVRREVLNAHLRTGTPAQDLRGGQVFPGGGEASMGEADIWDRYAFLDEDETGRVAGVERRIRAIAAIRAIALGNDSAEAGLSGAA